MRVLSWSLNCTQKCARHSWTITYKRGVDEAKALYMAGVTRKGTLGHLKLCRPRSAPLLCWKHIYTLSICSHSKEYKCHWCDECQKVQALVRRCVGDAAAGLGLHFLHMSEGPFSHDAGHYVNVPYIVPWLTLKTDIFWKYAFHISLSNVFLAITVLLLLISKWN